jgi:hypothetical protein
VHKRTHAPTHTHTHTHTKWWSFWYGLGNHQEATHQVPDIITSVLHIHNLFSVWMRIIFHPYTEWDIRCVCVCVCVCVCMVTWWTRFMEITHSLYRSAELMGYIGHTRRWVVQAYGLYGTHKKVSCASLWVIWDTQEGELQLFSQPVTNNMQKGIGMHGSVRRQQDTWYN